MTFRVHEKYRRERRPYAILCLPDQVGTTEAPDTVRKLVAQRERWQRVITETLWHYRRMLLNPRYGTVGMLGMPFYLLSEVAAPFFELASVLVVPLAFALGVYDWQISALMMTAIALGNAVLSGSAILADDRQSRTYRLGDLARLLALAPVDLVLYRPVISWARIKGMWRFFRNDKGWHKFERNRRLASA
jgi:cellulose synthase/poly-beta-1,6-N-acetylglucosamine synthase-like glycosyltransferase